MGVSRYARFAITTCVALSLAAWPSKEMEKL
jgi:hypothetical protein